MQATQQQTRLQTTGLGSTGFSDADMAEIENERSAKGGTMTRIGVVGLGAMGGRITKRLLSQGHEVYGTNRTKAKAQLLIEQGLVWRDSPREVAEAADVVVSMVTDSHALEAITGGPDGILAGLTAGKVYIDMSTVSPRASRELAERVASLGAAMLAAPVSGSLPAAEQGSLAINRRRRRRDV